MKRTNKKQRGFITTEIGIAVFVVTVLAITGYILSQSLVKDANVYSLVTQMVDTVKNVQLGYKSQGDFTGLSNTEVININAIPRTFISGTSLINEYAGAVTFAPVACDGSGSTLDCISLTQGSLPPEVCINYVSGMLDTSHTVTVGTTEVKASDEDSVTQSEVNSACNPESGSVDVVTLHTRS